MRKGKNKKKSQLVKEPKEVADLNYTMLGMQISKGENKEVPEEELKEGELRDQIESSGSTNKEDSPPQVSDF